MSLATLADLKTYLGITSATADVELTRLLDMASALVEQHVERTLAIGARMEKRSGKGGDILLLRDSPITAVATLTIDGKSVSASDGTTAGYLFDGESIYLIGGLSFCRGRKNVAVSYTAGYSTIPADIVHSVIEIAAQAYREKEWVGFTSKSLAGETVAFARSGLPESAKVALQPYRRMYACD